ncbi:murein L,D-transpeptidase catalytic domain family protein [Henriciella sp.]|uniref:murein L,D-transpeptidase catalytic domain family protein n=1 Tax=Henriciella sp. TaxID=1968823 RepID=UPI00261405A5|nr:murein L,D-transpeptidase catalytic domain family protein [Henriciella sp.]
MARYTRWFLVSLFLTLLPANLATAKTAQESMGVGLWQEAMAAHERYADEIGNDKYMVVIDYRRHSGEPRFFLIDMKTGSTKSYLVSHGRNSDKDHDGIADTFSNTSGSKMSSLGTFVTAETYYGKHGLSLRMDGLESQNDAARDRAIVIHGADYVTPKRAKMGRSWGCPALERGVAQDLIPKIADGVLVYTRGPGDQTQLYAEVVDKAG